MRENEDCKVGDCAAFEFGSGLSLALPLYLLKRMDGAEEANGKIGG